MTGITVVYDVTGSNYGHQPKGNLALYVTGFNGVPATDKQLAANPNAVLIDQSPNPGKWDELADVDDYERGAVQLSELAQRARERHTNFVEATRPGQRMPAVYVSASNVHDVANALNSGGVTNGVGLWLADWDLTETQAITDVLKAAGPFPIIGVQYHNAGLYDVSVFSTQWLNNRSHKSNTPSSPQPPPGQWKDPHEWTWKQASVMGTGLDGKQHVFTFDPAHNTWTKTG